MKTGRLESWRRFFFPPTFPVSPAASAITRSLTSHLRWLSPSKCRASSHPLSIPSCPLPPPTSLFPAESNTNLLRQKSSIPFSIPLRRACVGHPPLRLAFHCCRENVEFPDFGHRRFFSLGRFSERVKQRSTSDREIIVMMSNYAIVFILSFQICLLALERERTLEPTPAYLCRSALPPE